jgi:putative tricarboxylic transport membrane protein
MIFFGILAFFMKKYGFPVVPLLLALILGPNLEEHLRMSLIISQGNPMVFVRHPISLFFIIISLISLTAPFLVPAIKKELSKGAEKCTPKRDDTV